jgi:hypothetical protein
MFGQDVVGSEGAEDHKVFEASIISAPKPLWSAS